MSYLTGFVLPMRASASLWSDGNRTVDPSYQVDDKVGFLIDAGKSYR